MWRAAGARWITAAPRSDAAASSASSGTAASSESGDAQNEAEPLVYDAVFDPLCRNSVVLTGNVGADPELRRATTSGKLFARFSIAVPVNKQRANWCAAQRWLFSKPKSTCIANMQLDSF